MSIRDLVATVRKLAAFGVPADRLDEQMEPAERDQELLARKHLYPGQSSVRPYARPRVSGHGASG